MTTPEDLDAIEAALKIADRKTVEFDLAKASLARLREQMLTVPLDPDMPAQELRLHMGELTADEMRVARDAIRWANTGRSAAKAEPIEGIEQADNTLIGDAVPLMPEQAGGQAEREAIATLTQIINDELGGYPFKEAAEAIGVLMRALQQPAQPADETHLPKYPTDDMIDAGRNRLAKLQKASFAVQAGEVWTSMFDAMLPQPADETVEALLEKLIEMGYEAGICLELIDDNEWQFGARRLVCFTPADKLHGIGPTPAAALKAAIEAVRER
ncbi:hypothetical protein [Roseicella sp. DB1501]|uniref:hypothetical protein n=1 Tax=Roseicella sp. DB1501 TaxID=2730925 RepID=UPI0014923C00|nr:hypothetical protein [Roseicella sp. DB1501]NOG70491.1 hypothetical protein [Roseicella sp. DB1501]